MKTDIKGSGMRSYLEIDCSNLWENGRMDSSRKISFVVAKLVFWERMVSPNWAVDERSQSLYPFCAEDVDWFHQGGGFRGDTGSFQSMTIKVNFKGADLNFEDLVKFDAVGQADWFVVRNSMD